MCGSFTPHAAAAKAQKDALLAVRNQHAAMMKSSEAKDPRVVVFDMETTGFSRREDHIMCIGAVVCDSTFRRLEPSEATPNVVCESRVRVPDGVPVNRFALAVHGITKASCATADDFVTVAKRFMRFITDVAGEDGTGSSTS